MWVTMCNLTQVMAHTHVDHLEHWLASDPSHGNDWCLCSNPTIQLHFGKPVYITNDTAYHLTFVDHSREKVKGRQPQKARVEATIKHASVVHVPVLCPPLGAECEVGLRDVCVRYIGTYKSMKQAMWADRLKMFTEFNLLGAQAKP